MHKRNGEHHQAKRYYTYVFARRKDHLAYPTQLAAHNIDGTAAAAMVSEVDAGCSLGDAGGSLGDAGAAVSATIVAVSATLVAV